MRWGWWYLNVLEAINPAPKGGIFSLEEVGPDRYIICTSVEIQ